MRKVLLVLLALLPEMVWGQGGIRFEHDGYVYQQAGEQMRCTLVQHPQELPSEVVIPETVTHEDVTYLVTGINDRCFNNSSTLEVITLPGSMWAVHTKFLNCPRLREINVTQSINLPGGERIFSEDGILYSYQPNLLLRCPQAKTGDVKVHYGSGIEREAFRESSISSLSGWNVSSVFELAFKDCKHLTHVSLLTDRFGFGLSTMIIDKGAFQGCTNLTDVTLADQYTNISDGTFSGCTSLKSLTMPSNLKYLGSKVFEGSQLSTITIPESVISISDSAFQDCHYLTEVKWPNKALAIPESAFKNCDAMTSFIIPEELTEIRKGAFAGCCALTDIYCHPITPPSLGEGALGNTAVIEGQEKCVTVHVGKGYKDVYAHADDWCGQHIVDDLNLSGITDKRQARSFLEGHPLWVMHETAYSIDWSRMPITRRAGYEHEIDRRDVICDWEVHDPRYTMVCYFVRDIKQEVDGKQYKALCKVCPDDTMDGIGAEDIQTVLLLREENGRVYANKESCMKFMKDLKANIWSSSLDEWCLLDFNLKRRDKWNRNLNVIRIDSINVEGGSSRLVWEIADNTKTIRYFFTEQLGTHDPDVLSPFNLSKIATTEKDFDQLSFACLDAYYLDGKLVYKIPETYTPHETRTYHDNRTQLQAEAHKYREPSLLMEIIEMSQCNEALDYDAITLVSADVPSADTLYDLQGRRLFAIPQRGVYIRSGKKHVAY